MNNFFFQVAVFIFLVPNSLEHISWAEITYLVLLNNYCFLLTEVYIQVSLDFTLCLMAMCPQAPPGCDSLSDFTTLTGGLVRYFAGCSWIQVCVMFFSWLDWGHGFWRSCTYPIKGTCVVYFWIMTNMSPTPGAPQTDRCSLKSVLLPDVHLLP